MSRLQRVITTVEDTRDVERAAVLMKSVARATPDRGRASMMYGSQRGLRLHGAWGLVVGVVAWNFVNLRAETLAVPYLDDSSVHEQMVRFATLQLESWPSSFDEVVSILGARVSAVSPLPVVAGDAHRPYRHGRRA